MFDPKNDIIDQSWHADITVKPAHCLNGQPVMSPSELTNILKRTIKSKLDQSILIPIKSKLIDFRSSRNDNTRILDVLASCKHKKSKLSYKCPETDISPIMAQIITPKNVALEVKKMIQLRLPSIVTNVELALKND